MSCCFHLEEEEQYPLSAERHIIISSLIVQNTKRTEVIKKVREKRREELLCNSS